VLTVDCALLSKLHTIDCSLHSLLTAYYTVTKVGGWLNFAVSAFFLKKKEQSVLFQPIALCCNTNFVLTVGTIKRERESLYDHLSTAWTVSLLVIEHVRMFRDVILWLLLFTKKQRI
jgi:hypothetical protein